MCFHRILPNLKYQKKYLNQTAGLLLKCLFFFLLADVDTRCKEFDNGTSLHIAASNLCLEGAKCLVRAH